MRERTFELFYEKFVPGQIFDVPSLNKATDAIRTERLSAETSVVLQKISLHNGPDFGCFVAHLLKKRLKLTFFERGYESGIVGLDLQLVDRHRQFQLAVQIDHFPVLQYLLASVGDFLAGARAFHLI